MMQRLMSCMRQTWLRRTLLALMLILGCSFTFLDVSQAGHPASEVVCHEFYDDECEHMPVLPTLAALPDPLVDSPEDNRPVCQLVQAPREQAQEPEHAPPREG